MTIVYFSKSIKVNLGVKEVLRNFGWPSKFLTWRSETTSQPPRTPRRQERLGRGRSEFGRACGTDFGQSIAHVKVVEIRLGVRLRPEADLARGGKCGILGFQILGSIKITGDPGTNHRDAHGVPLLVARQPSPTGTEFACRARPCTRGSCPRAGYSARCSSCSYPRLARRAPPPWSSSPATACNRTLRSTSLK